MFFKIRKTTHTVMFNTKNLPVVVIYLLFTFLFSSSVFSEARYIYRIPWHGEGKWLIGDTHMHTIHSDGYYTVDEVAEKSFQYGCDFIAFTNHDVSIPQDKLDSARLKYPSMLIFQGTEWTMPAGEHCCIIVPKHPGETAYINEFLSNFSWRSAPHKPDTDADSQAGFIWLDTHTISGLKPVAIINHPNRENIYSYAKLYNYFLMGDALIGFSGAPGAQNRDPYYNTIDGWDIIYAQVGNMVDRLLNNGIKVTAARAPSDFHGDKDERWPGEYSRTHIYVKDKTYDSIIEGFRAGAAFADHDNICSKVEFTMDTGKLTGIIPCEIVLIDKGDDVNVNIRIKPNKGVFFDEIQIISNKNKLPAVSNTFEANNNLVTIIPFDAQWKYVFPEKAPRNWEKTNFNDSSWECGVGLFGYGFPTINTVLSRDIADPLNKRRDSIPKEYPVTYFRKHFYIEDYDLISDFAADMRFCDGFVMYVNGKEVLRKNMPEGKIDHKTSAAKSQGGPLITYSVRKKYFKKGINVIAVGLFQVIGKGKQKNTNNPKVHEGRYKAKFELQLRGIPDKKSKPDWNSTNDWLEMNCEYKNLKNDFYVRARGRTSVPYKKWFYANPILVKVRN